jgi:hypothetical protein
MPPAVSEALPREGEDLAAADVEFARLQVLDLELYDDDRPPPPAAIDAEAAPRADAPRADAPPPADVGRHEEISVDDISLEFTLPPGELDRIFVEPKRRQPSSAPGAPSSATAPGTAAAPRPGAAPGANAALSATAAPRASVAPRTGATRAAVKPDAAPPTDAVRPPDATADTAQASDDGPATAAESPRPLGMEVSEDVRRDMLAGFKRPLPEIAAPPARSVPFGVWLGAAIVLALTLAAQVIRENPRWLAADTPTPANLSAYQLRQWGVTGDPSANGTLRVRASILNAAAQLQPYPLLRVTLANRFGSRIGARDFEPAEYLGKPTARMLAPGERVDATLDILDPGKDAEGFEIDVCLRGVDQRVACAGEQTKQ